MNCNSLKHDQLIQLVRAIYVLYCDGKKKITRYNQMIVAIVDVLTSFDVVTNDNR